jgi:hypothetical protein
VGVFPLLWLWFAPVGGATPTQPVAEALETHLGAAGCADAGPLSEQLEVWTRNPELDARLRIVVREDEARRQRARFELWSAEEELVERSIEPLPTDCDAYRAALALAIAFALDATVLQELGVPPADPEPPPESELAPLPEEGEDERGEERLTSREVSRGVRGGVDLGGAAGLGLSPGVTLGGGLNLRFALHPKLSLVFGGEVQQGLSQPLGEGQIAMRFVMARVALCGGGELRRVDLRGCAGTLAGSVWIDGKDYEVEHQTRAPWVALTLGPQVRAPLSSRFSFVAALDAVLPLARVEARVLDSGGGVGGLSLRPPAVGGRLFMGLGVRFP